MPFKKFGKNDLFYNQIKTFPECDFVIYDSRVYFNNFKNADSRVGTNGDLLGVPQGFISLYELNVDRTIDTGTGQPPDGKSIYPFITKEGARVAFKTVSTSDFDTTSQFAYGDVIKSKYPLSSSIKRTRFVQTTNSQIEDVAANHNAGNHGTSPRFAGTFTRAIGNKKHLLALKNTFNKHVNISQHYAFSSSIKTDTLTNWDKGLQEMSLIEVPSIFYGSQIDKGSVRLQIFKTGSLVAECRDVNKNGELIQVSGTYNAKTNNGKVAGVVLYDEGFVALTGSWDLTDSSITDPYVGTTNSRGKWLHFGAGANDGEARGSLTEVLFKMNFKGVNYVPTITMMAHMPKGEYNNSTNPTVYVKNQSRDPVTSSIRYQEFKELQFEKLEHGEYLRHTGSFEKQTYVSKIGIYDEQKRLIGIAKLANPVRKTENREYTFKLKLDI